MFKQSKVVGERRGDHAQVFGDGAGRKALVACRYKHSKDIESSVLRQRAERFYRLSFFHETSRHPDREIFLSKLIGFFGKTH